MTTDGTAATPTIPLAPWALRCRACEADHPPAPVAICPACLGPLDPVPPVGRRLPSREEIAARPTSLWRYREWLPFTGDPVVSTEVGYTPLLDAPELARCLGVRRVWIKGDLFSVPSLSFKDRVVATALNAARAFGLSAVGCASTGNLGNAVAAQAAGAGIPAWIFIPEDLEMGKIVGSAVCGARVVRIRGHYDDVNRLCTQVADRCGWGIVNVNLRGYYGEGSKTMAFEIAEQLGWRLPTAVVAPMAGGSLVTKLARGFQEFREAGLVSGPAPRVHGVQAAGCAPIIHLFDRGEGSTAIEPVIPATIARSIAIGNPPDGLYAVRTIRESGGWAVAVPERDLVEGMTRLARTTGLFAETAGGVTVGGAIHLARRGHLTAADEVVLCITGHGFKTPEPVAAVLPPGPVIAPRFRDVQNLIDKETK